MLGFLSRALRVAAFLAVAIFFAVGARAAGPALQSGIDTTNLDRTCKPCQDFFQFANGGWLRRNPIPPSYSSYSNFQKLYDRNEDVLHGILSRAAASHAVKGSNLQKIGDFYVSCTNMAAIDAAGTKPIDPLLRSAAGAGVSSLATTLASLQAAGAGSFFGFGPGADFYDSHTNIIQLRQGGLGLPDRDYYLNDDAKTTSIRNAYVAHVQTMFQLLGDTSTTAAGEAQSVLQTETALAKVELSRVASRDPANVYHKMSFAQLQALAPKFNWQAYFATRGIPTTVTINVAQPDFFKGFSDLLGTIGEPSLQTYLRWHVAHAYANALSQPFVDANFAFFSHTLQGTPQQQPRWKTCVQATNSALGEALGQYYVEQTFPPAAKVQALAMVRNIKQTLRDDFSTLEWMSPQTRLRADQKLDAFLLKIGYPDRWQDHRALPISKQSYAGNEIAAAHYESSRAMARIGHPVDRALWGMTPPTVNAYYNPSVNEIVFPAGILQPPFYNKNADMAVNYGGIGAVIGHESTHGFDDEGRKFDLNGNLTDWWSAQDATRFSARAQCVVDQWNKLSPLPGVHENGQLVQGEEIADLGGLTIAYKAFEKWQSHHPRRTIDGFTPEQRFFMGWAQVWAGQDRPASIALRAKTDVHGYDKFRVNQTVANLPGFAQAFFCKLNDPMYLAPKDRCQIW